jgi:hypothetical protein
MQNAPGVTFIVKEMVKHLVNLIFVNTLLIFLVHKRTKSGAEYNIKLIVQPTNYFKFSAAIIGLSFMAIAILIVFVFVQNVMVVIAAVFISFGTGATDLCLGTGCRNNEPECFLVILGINSSIACKE